MNAKPFDIGFRVVGHITAKRRAISHPAAFAAHASCDPRAELDRESYLSAFVFDRAFDRYLTENDSEAAYPGPCGASWIWWDIDRADDLEAALRDSRRLAGRVLDRHPEFDDEDLLIFFSGSKGVHVGIPAVWNPQPSPTFHVSARHFCLTLAEAAGVVADPSIYSKTRLFRAPNSWHPKTGLYKRRLSLKELTHLTPSAIVDLARHPEPFDIPTGPASCASADDDWCAACRAVEQRAQHRATPRNGPARLSAFARRYVRDGELDATQREVSTFRVAAELAEVGLAKGLDGLVFALLEESALDSGLSPSEVRHAIEGGVRHAQRQTQGGAA